MPGSAPNNKIRVPARLLCLGTAVPEFFCDRTAFTLSVRKAASGPSAEKDL
ncbi:hypothetical protein HMPREF1548_03778 [Clostridium sp. KLE 1755]|nr:hypothetical protein HMPREF1548_03778 [Clostridium sp. KLE 1755]